MTYYPDDEYSTHVSKTNIYGDDATHGSYHRSLHSSILDNTRLLSELGLSYDKEWWAKLLPRIGITAITPTQDPQDLFGMFSGPEFAFGQYLQRIKIRARQHEPENYIPKDWDGTNYPDPFKIHRVKSWELFGRRNIHKSYRQSIHDSEYRAAFTSPQTMGDYVAGLIAAMRTDYLMDNEVTFLRFLRTVISGNVYSLSTDTPVSNLGNIFTEMDDLDTLNPNIAGYSQPTEANENAIALAFIRNLQDKMALTADVRPDYNRFGEYVKYDNPVMFVPRWFATILKRVTARIYHDQKLALPVDIIPIRDFPLSPEPYYEYPGKTTASVCTEPTQCNNKYIYAFVVDRHAIQWMPSKATTEEMRNPAGDYVNYFLKLEGMLSYVPWYPELVWTGKDQTPPTPGP